MAKKAEASNPSLLIEMWPIERPTDYPKNARKWSKNAIGKVSASIREYGFRQPLVVDKHGVIVIGHLRRTAARSLGMTEVPVHVAKDLTAEQCRGLRLMDNRSALESTFDLEMLGPELLELKAMDFDLSLTGFDVREIESFTLAPNPAEDDVPPVPEAPVSQAGDLWLLGEHRLLCGDSTKAEDVARVMGTEKADVMWTDPPFGVSYVGKTNRSLTIQNDTSVGLRGLLDGFLACAKCALAPSSPFYIAHPAGAQYLIFGRAVEDAGWKIHQNLVWAKDSMVLGHSDYHFQHEPILYGFTPGDGRPGRGNHIGSHWYGDHSQVSIFQVPRPKRSEEHPTMKPVELIRRCLRNSTPARGIVFEPFSGSGSTIIACEEMGYKARAIDLEPSYVDVAVSRWQNLTNKQATLEGHGATFEHVKFGRRLGAEDAIKEEIYGQA